MGKNQAEVQFHLVQNRKAHRANEKTFRGWVRTSIGIMALGFVAERFSLFEKMTLGSFHES